MVYSHVQRFKHRKCVDFYILRPSGGLFSLGKLTFLLLLFLLRGGPVSLFLKPRSTKGRFSQWLLDDAFVSFAGLKDSVAEYIQGQWTLQPLRTVFLPRNLLLVSPLPSGFAFSLLLRVLSSWWALINNQIIILLMSLKLGIYWDLEKRFLFFFTYVCIRMGGYISQGSLEEHDLLIEYIY